MFIWLKRCVCLLFLISSLSCNADKKKVTMDNLDAFKSTMNSSLPIGSSKQAVGAYLKQLDLTHSYDSDDKKFYAIVPNIGKFKVVYETSLLIRLNLDEEEKLKGIEYELEHDGL